MKSFPLPAAGLPLATTGMGAGAPRAARRSAARALAIGAAALALLAVPASASEPVPKGYREAQRHHFRDVQLGVRHPAVSAPGAGSAVETPPPRQTQPQGTPPATGAGGK